MARQSTTLPLAAVMGETRQPLTLPLATVDPQAAPTTKRAPTTIPLAELGIRQSTTLPLSVLGVPSLPPAGGSRAPRRTGLLEVGNVDLFKQPVVKNPAGGTSTVYSFSVNLDDKEYLLPRVTPDGRLLSEDDAIKEFTKTGRHLGAFSDADSATAYAKQLHEEYEAGKYAPKQELLGKATTIGAPPGRATPPVVAAGGRGTQLDVGRSAERVGRAVRAPAAGAYRGLTVGAWGAIRSAADLLGLDSVAEYAGRVTEAAQRTSEAIAGPEVSGAGPTEKAVYSGLESAGLAVPAIAAGVASGSPAATLGVMGVQSGGEAYQEARTKGVPPVRAATYATAQGLIEALTEKIPASRLLDDLAKKTGAIEMVMRQLVAEIPGEQVATIGQDLNDWVALNPEKTLSDYAAARPGAAAQTLVATIVGTVTQTGGAATASRLAQRPAGASRTEGRPDEAQAADVAPAAEPAPAGAAVAPRRTFAQFVAEKAEPIRQALLARRVDVLPPPSPGILPDDIEARLNAPPVVEEPSGDSPAAPAPPVPVETAPAPPPGLVPGVARPETAGDMLKRSDYNASLRATYYDEEGKRIGASRTMPQTALIPPVGTWMVEDSFAALDGHEIEQLIEVPVENIEISEDTGRAKFVDVERFARWTLEGKEAPPIQVVQTDRGTLKTLDHRRLLAAKAAGLPTIKAWVSWTTTSPRQGNPTVGLTRELAETGAQPLPVSLAKPEQTIFSDDRTLLAELRTRLQAPSASQIAPTEPQVEAGTPVERPYLTDAMKPSDMMWAYVEQTWGSRFGQQDLVDAVVQAAASGSRGRPNQNRNGAPFWRGPAANRTAQRQRVREWMDWNDRQLAALDVGARPAQTTPDAPGSEEGEGPGAAGVSPLDRITASLPPTRYVTDKQGREHFKAETTAESRQRRTAHYRDVFRHVLADAQADDPLVDEPTLRKAFDERVDLLEELDDEYRASGHNPRELLDAIARAGGISIAAEEGGGLTGELRWLRENAAGPYGNFAGVPNVFRQRTTTREHMRGVSEAGLSLDDMATRLRQDPRFAHIEGPNELLAELEDISRLGNVGARGAVYPGTEELARRAGMRRGNRWWEAPEQATEPEPLTAESYQRLFGGTKEQAEAVVRVYQAMGIQMERVFVAKGGGTATDLEQRGDDLPRLTVLHNIHVEGLIHADKIGGLAVPSLGVVREGDAYSGMGNITLIGKPHLGDPTIEPIYDADVWSQTFPRPEYRKARSSDMQPVVDELRPFTARFENSRRAIDVLWDNAVNDPNPQDSVSSLLRSNAAKAWFLSTHGISVEPVIRDARLTLPWVEYLDYARFRQIVPFNDERSMPESEQALKDAVPVIREAIDRYVKESTEGQRIRSDAMDAQRARYRGDPEAQARAWAATVFGISGDWVNDPDGQLPMSLDWKITDSHNNLGKREVDESATETRLNEALKGKESEFKTWLEQKVLSLHPPPHVTVGKTKRPYTLAHIVDAMTGRVRAVQQHLTFGEGKARAAAAKKFTDLEQMRRWAASNIRPEEEIDEAREQAKQAVSAWRDEVVRYYGTSVERGESEFGRVWEGLDASMRALARWARGRKDADAFLNALAREGFSRVPIDVARDGVRAGMLWLKAPVPYFEAKPQRAVMLHEFAGAAIPDNADPAVKAILDKHGIRYREYDTSGTDTDPEFQRAEAVRALENELEGQGTRVLFQPAYRQGPKGSVEFTGAGEAIVRALKNPDVSTGVHEAAHVARRFLFDRALPLEMREGITDEDILTAEQWAGAKDGEWSRDAEEKFARGFERYLADGTAPTPTLRSLFAKFAEWLGRIYQNLTGSPIDIDISPAMRGVFDRLITRSERLQQAEAEGDTSFDVAAFERDVETLYQDDTSPEYQAALAASRRASRTFDEAKRRYMAREIDDAAYREAFRDHERASASFEKVFEAEAKRRSGKGKRTDAPTSRARSMDLLDTGEAQPRLPGAESVREQEIATPTLDVPFSLTPEVSRAKKGRQDTLFQQPPAKARTRERVIQLEDLERLATRRGISVNRARQLAEEAGYAVIDGQRASWDAPEPSRMDNLIHVLQDKHVDTKRVVTAIGEVADADDVYLQEELFHGRAAYWTQRFLDEELDPLLTEMAGRGMSVADLDAYLHARHAEEANRVIAERNPDLPDGGSGLTDDEARAYLAGLTPAQRTALEPLAARVDAMIEDTRNLIVRSGLESADTVEGWRQTYEYYVPLQREDMGDGRPGTGQGFSVRGPATRQRRGSERRVVDILANVAMQRERQIVRAEKNRVGQALYGLAKANPNPEFWRIARPGVTTATTTETGEAVDVVDMSYQGRDNVIMFRDVGSDGRIVQRGVEFNERNPRAARMVAALKNLDMDAMGELLGTAAQITRYVASINTQYNPVFGVVNLTRDVQGALLNLTTTPIAGQQAAVWRRTFQALPGIYRDLRARRSGQEATSAWAQTFEEFQREGGATGYRDLYTTSADRGKAIEREIAAFGRRTGHPAVLGRGVLHWLSDYNWAMENATRVAAYSVAREQGLSRQRAASLAKNLTVNFNRKGALSRQAGALYAFFNASSQGLARLGETLTGPKGRQIIAGGILVGVMQELLLRAAGFGDDEPPEFIRERSLILPIGDGKYLTLPMPLGFHVLPNIGRIGTSIVMDGAEESGRRVADLFSVAMEAFNPLGSAGLSVQTLTPTALDPLVALAENRDWTGQPIARQDISRLAPTPGHSRAKDTATAAGHLISRALNAASGGTDYTPGLLSPTPDQIDYLIEQATGGIGRELSKAEQTVSSVATGEELPTYKIPLVGRFYGETTGQASQARRFYANLLRLNSHEAEVRGRLKAGDAIDAYMRAHPEARLILVANRAERRMSELRKEKRDFVKTGDKAAVVRTEKAMTALMRGMNGMVDRARGRASAP